MKTLTEFSTLMLRKAAQARATVPAAHAPRGGTNTETADTSGATSDEASVESASDGPSEATAEVVGDSAGSAGDMAPGAAIEAAPSHEAEAQAATSDASGDAADNAAQAASDDESGAAAEQSGEAAGEARDFAADPAIAAVAAACGVQPDRAARLLEALDIVNRDLDRVRLVRVYQGEKGPHNAVSRGEFHYVVDRVAAPPRERRNNKAGHGGPPGRDNRDNRDRPSGGGAGGGAGGSFRGSDRKPRGLGSLKFGAVTETKDPNDERPGRGEMPRAGIGWQLTPSPRTAEDFARGMGRRRPPNGRKPRGTRGGPHGRQTERDSRNSNPSQIVSRDAAPAPAPRLGPDGQPVPPRRKQPRKPLGPDANGLGPDGKPWDPERRAKRMAERSSKMNEVRPDNAQTPAETPALQSPEDSK